MNRAINFITQICISLAFLIATASCHSLYSFETLMPAKYTLPGNIDTLLIVSGVRPNNWTDSTYISNDFLREGIVFIDNRITLVVPTIAYTELNAYQYIPVKVHNKIIDSEIVPYIADSLCSAYHANAILLLDSLDLKITHTPVRPDNLENYNNQDEYYIKSNATGRCKWALISRTGHRREFEPYNKSIEGASDLFELKTHRVISYEISKELATQMAADLTPSWTKIERFAFYSHNRKFIDAIDLLEQENFKASRDLLYSIYENSHKKNRFRAAIDISLTYEREGNIDAAAIWCSKALDILDEFHGMKSEKEYCNELFGMLEARKKDLLRLDRQMTKRKH